MTTTAKTYRDVEGNGAVPAGANEKVRAWVDEHVAICRPERVVWCDGTEAERQKFFAEGVREGVFIKLNQEKLPGCYLHRSNPNDVARSEQLTFICTPSEDMAGGTNNWWEPKKAYARLCELF